MASVGGPGASLGGVRRARVDSRGDVAALALVDIARLVCRVLCASLSNGNLFICS